MGSPPQGDILRLENTVDYANLLAIAKRHFAQPHELLEELVLLIARNIKSDYPFIEYQKVSIQKNNPPLGEQVQSSEVYYETQYTV